MRLSVGHDGRAKALTAIVLAAVIQAVGGGCGSGAAAPNDAGDGAIIVDDDAGGGELDAAPDLPPPVCPASGGEIQNATCNDQVAAGPCVDQIRIDDSAPAPAGGTLVPGTYDLVERIAYTSPGGATGPVGEPRQETFVLAGDGADFTISSAVLSAATTTRQVATAALASAQFKLTMTASCPAPAAPVVYYYTAADTTLTLHRIAATGPVLADSYVRR